MSAIDRFVRNPTVVFLVFGLGTMTGSARAAEGLWQTDFEAAKSEARAAQKLLLVDFTGSDWCGWCIKLRQEVFDKTEFQTEAPKRFVLVEVDFPRTKKISAEQKKQNGELGGRYQIRGFPTVLVLDPDGPVVARTGYRAGGPEEYMKHLVAFADAYASIRKLKQELKAVQGLDRAKVLDQLIDGYVKLGSEMNELPAWRKEIIALDPDNKAGLKAKHEFRLLLDQCAELRRAGKFSESREAAKQAMAMPGLTGRQKQEVFMTQCETFLAQKDFAGAVFCLHKALDAAGDGDQAPLIKSLVERFQPLAAAQEKVAKLKDDLADAKGLDRARTLDQLIEGTAKLAAAGVPAESGQVDQWAREIVRLDARNKAGLKRKYEFRVRLADATKLIENHKLAAGRTAITRILALPGLSGEQIQEANLALARCWLAEKNYKKGLGILKKALEAAPQGPRAALVKSLISQAENGLKQQKTQKN